MSETAVFAPYELKLLTECSLRYHFEQQQAESAPDAIEEALFETIQSLHAGGGPHRVNLPTTLRYLSEQVLGREETGLAHTTARTMLATYHRRLRQDWPRIIASTEALSLPLKLRALTVGCEAIIDRVDNEVDGGVTGILFLTDTASLPDELSSDDIETTMFHALLAAAYPHKRPVRITYWWLQHDQGLTIELTEKIYRQNLNHMRARLQAWLNDEILARPGLYCHDCPFKSNGCPIFAGNPNFQPANDLPEPPSSATLSDRTWHYQEDNEQTTPDP